MPSLRHFTFDAYESFYEPAEDSFLLMDALSADAAALAAAPAALCVELGYVLAAVVLLGDHPTAIDVWTSSARDLAQLRSCCRVVVMLRSELWRWRCLWSDCDSVTVLWL